MTPRNGQSIFGHDLAFKSAEIEELTDVYFFRPAGLLVARTGHSIGLSPIGLTIIGAIIGVAGGLLLYDQRFGLFGFAVLILHSIVDSADGQLARLTGKVSELGRVLDGLGGYATHVAIFLAIATGLVHRGVPQRVFLWMLLAGISTAVHAGMYDYFRNAYTAVVAEGRIPHNAPRNVPPPIGWLFRFYIMVQRGIVGLHSQVEASLAARSVAGQVRDEDRGRYRESFYALVRGWNFLGDNTRFFVIGILALFHRIDLFFPFILIAMNLAFGGLWLWQRSVDRRFLASLASSKLTPE